MVALVIADATISSDGRYRYRLSRSWTDGPRMLFVMLNPSTADASVDDPTIRRCVRFAEREGCGSLEVVNLFGLRSSSPRALLEAVVDPVGADNLRHVRDAGELATGGVVVAWGAHPLATRQRVTATLSALFERSPALGVRALGTTSSGAPKHPLARGRHRIPDDAPLVAWRSR